MGTAANPVVEQPSSETTSDQVEALLEAARYDDLDDVVSLASSGVSLDSKDSLGRTALHMAAANGHLDVVEYLINRGVVMIVKLLKEQFCEFLVLLYEQDLNAINEEKNTPLHWACLNGHIEVVKKLILAGANVTELNSYERTPMDEAVSGGKMDVIDAINAAVAQLELTGVSVS
ncbi:ankyrin repeat-containing protein P16F5.05c isoform X1 [Quercus lobata]|uniref:ankyrin repeat-containing protein P16F5.05c isoform X1 n=1 Tax=Quercus lobata TaxID=97700 RepID=UPI001245931D|nr:ankyrin repeat-containing protein P16F5.05c isoform X1 [Quercus lobata]